MKEENLHWLVGLLEGEGSFMRGSPSSPNSPRIAVQMTDEDVVARAAALLGVGYTKNGADPRNPNWKLTFSAKVRGARAVDLMLQLQPYMGARRYAQIDAALVGYVPRAPGPPGVLTAAQIAEIRSSSAPLSALALHYKVSRPTISRALGR